MKLFKNIILIITLIFMCMSPLYARIGNAPAQPAPQPVQQPAPQPMPQPVPAPAPIPQPIPPQQQPPLPQQAPGKKSFNDCMTELRTQWKQQDVINAQGIFTQKFITFVMSAKLDPLLTQTLLEAGKNLYLPLSDNMAQNQQSMNAADTMIKHSVLDQRYPFYNSRTKLFKQDHIDEAVRGFAATNPNKASLDTFRDSMLRRLDDHWNTIGEPNTAPLIPKARQQINSSLEKYGLIKPIMPPAIPQPQPVPQQQPVLAPQPVQLPAQPPAPPAAPQATSPITLKIGNTTVKIVKGDLLAQRVDAIVNAANDDLNHAGGIAGKISDAAGPQLQAYCDKMPLIMPIVDPSSPQNVKMAKCPTGKAVITPSFNLAAKGIKNIIHATGPLGNNPKREQLLADAYTNSLKVAQQNGIKSIAFPAISTAIFGYPIAQATPIAFAAVRDFLEQNPNVFNEVRFVLLSDNDFGVYAKLVVGL